LLVDVERVARIKTVVGIARIQHHRGVADVARGVDLRSGPGHRAIRSDKQVGIDVSEFAAGIEPDPAVVDARAGDERIAVPEQLCVIGELQRAAEHTRIGRGAIDRAVRRAGDERDRRAGGIENLEIAGRLAGKPVVVQAQGAVERRVALLDISVVAVDVLLAKAPHIEAGLHRPWPTQVELAVDGGERHFVFRGLRPRVD
jgi:hypothetical protein